MSSPAPPNPSQLTLTPASTQAQPQTQAYLGHRLQVGPHRSSKCGHCRRMSSWKENRCCNSRNCASLSARFRKQYLDRDYLQLCIKSAAAISNDRHNNRKNLSALQQSGRYGKVKFTCTIYFTSKTAAVYFIRCQIFWPFNKRSLLRRGF